MTNKKLDRGFFIRDVLDVAPDLINKILARRLPSGEILRFRITETEAYRGEDDSACHAKAGKTKRTSVLYEIGGYSYVYLCYGIHYLLNVVTGNVDFPQAALIRGGIRLATPDNANKCEIASIALKNHDGPAKLTKAANINLSQNRLDLTCSDEIWIEDDGIIPLYATAPRVGIDYASEPYRSIHWRFIAHDVHI